MNYSIETYKITFINDKEKGANFTLTPNSAEQRAFKDEDLMKIYIVVDEQNKQYCYVGEAHTSIKKRFQRGFTSYRYAQRNEGKGRNGYAGYKWIPYGIQRKELKVFVVLIEDDTIDRAFVEAVKGELVYQIRNVSGEWPLYQNEIHFYREDAGLLTRGSKKVARNLFKVVKF